MLNRKKTALTRTSVLRVLLLVTVLFVGRTASAWSECGHHIISLLAFDLLSTADQERLLSLLATHPRYQEDFEPPESIRGVQQITRWRVGRAGYWPDVARQQPEYDRPKWHYQLAATLTMGNRAACEIPTTPGPCPPTATLETQELHIAQAIALCRRVMCNRDAPAADRAIALTWLAHLVGDAHQPCHAGSLYAERALPQGDRGANSIPIHPDRNMHWVWDDLLGRRFNQDAVHQCVTEVTRQEELQRIGLRAARHPRGLDPLIWLQESRESAVRYVYTADVLRAVTLVSRKLTNEVQPIGLSTNYMKRAKEVARERAAQASYRLAAIWREGLGERR